MFILFAISPSLSHKINFVACNLPKYLESFGMRGTNFASISLVTTRSSNGMYMLNASPPLTIRSPMDFVAVVSSPIVSNIMSLILSVTKTYTNFSNVLVECVECIRALNLATSPA